MAPYFQKKPLFELLHQLQQRLSGIHIIMEGMNDILLWTRDRNHTFSIRSAYNKWEELTHNSTTSLREIWRNLSPPKVEVFVWKAAQDRIASRSVLASRGNLFDEGYVQRSMKLPHTSCYIASSHGKFGRAF